jgi:uncharacterized protein (DUF1778 family)
VVVFEKGMTVMSQRASRTNQESETKQSDRFDMRMPPEQKELLQRAADLQGRSLKDFVMDSAQRAAQEVIREHDVMTLSARDSRAFADAMLNPREPNAALRRAVARYRRDVEER